jgi:ferrous iron transport protein B
MSCHDTPATPVATLERTATVALVGNPNVGKSTLFNALTGARQKVTNAPGTTVELQVGTWRGLRTRARAEQSRQRVRLLDLPGTYSLLARSPDERVTADAVAGRGSLDAPDLAVVLVEAAALSRSLYLLAQVAQSGQRVVVALTMTDVAAARGIEVDAATLADVLGVPVAAIDPRAGRGLDRLGAAVVDALAEGTGTVRGIDPLPAAALLAEDAEADVDRAAALFDWVEATLAALAPADAAPAPAPVRTLSDRVDRVLLDPWFGIPVFLAVMWAMFQLATTVAGPLIDGVDGLVNGTLVDGVLAGVGTVLSFAPLMALVFLAIAILEDSGYLARAAFVADRAMRAIGLDGRAMLPLVIGFGCNLPALSATRTLPNARSRLLTGLLVPYTSCPARLTVYILLAGIFFPDQAGTAIFAMYVASIALVVLGGLGLRRTLFRDLHREPLVLALPAYQRPRVRALLLSAWSRVASFVTKAGTIIVATLTVVWVLMAVPVTGQHTIGDVPVQDSAYGRAAEAIAPVFAPAGFDDWHMSAALATGFVAKEVVVGSFAQSYAVDEPEDPAQAGDLGSRIRATFEESSGGHAAAAALAFMVFVLAYTPCLATVGEQRRLYGMRWTAGAVGVQLAVAWVLSVVVFQVGRLL